MKVIRLWGPVYVWMALIFIFSSQPSVHVSDEKILNFLFFKFLHVVEYAMLYVLLFRATGKYFLTFLITMLYAISDEIHQTYVPSREGRVRDVIIDAIGAGIAWLIVTNLLQKMPAKLKRWVRGW